MRRHAGFTLVEVLVALFVMAAIAAMAWQGIDGITRARAASNEHLERALRIQTVLSQWEQDLAALQDSRIVPPLGFDGATLRLTRRTATGLQMVVWSMRGDAWWRWAGAPTTQASELQQQWLASQQLIGQENNQLRMLDGLTDWHVYYYRVNGWSNAQSTGDVTGDNTDPQASPPPAEGGASAPGGNRPQRELLPSGVRIVLTLNQGVLTRDVALEPQTP